MAWQLNHLEHKFVIIYPLSVIARQRRWSNEKESPPLLRRVCAFYYEYFTTNSWSSWSETTKRIRTTRRGRLGDDTQCGGTFLGGKGKRERQGSLRICFVSCRWRFRAAVKGIPTRMVRICCLAGRLLLVCSWDNYSEQQVHVLPRVNIVNGGN